MVIFIWEYAGLTAGTHGYLLFTDTGGYSQVASLRVQVKVPVGWKQMRVSVAATSEPTGGGYGDPDGTCPGALPRIIEAFFFLR